MRCSGKNRAAFCPGYNVQHSVYTVTGRRQQVIEPFQVNMMLCPGRHDILPRKHNVYILAEFKIAISANRLNYQNTCHSRILPILLNYCSLLRGQICCTVDNCCNLIIQKNDSLEKIKFLVKNAYFEFCEIFLTMLSFQGLHE